jgi:hypothetical protein
VSGEEDVTTATRHPAVVRWQGWLTQDRLSALPGSRQAFTARLVGGTGQTFSVILTFPPTAADPDATAGDVELLAPDLLPDVEAELRPGRVLTIYSGPREVAACEILPTRP